MRRISFNVLFFIKKTKLLKNGEASVCMRITVDGQRVETNIRKSVDPSSWNQAKECVRGKSRKANELNSYIEEAKIKLHSIFTELEEQGSTITARILQEKFFGLNILKEQPKTLLATIDRKSTRLNSSHANISYAVFCLKKKNNYTSQPLQNQFH